MQLSILFQSLMLSLDETHVKKSIHIPIVPQAVVQLQSGHVSVLINRLAVDKNKFWLSVESA
ncbi:MAG: hypothetical protein JSR33_05950 [Proteobacteria bacterium]|nr:hypothetical protein [Pseudomonadota bacterium]